MKTIIDREKLLKVLLEKGWETNYRYSRELSVKEIRTSLFINMIKIDGRISNFRMNRGIKIILAKEQELRLYFLIYHLYRRIKSLTSKFTKSDYEYVVIFVMDKVKCGIKVGSLNFSDDDLRISLGD